MHTAQHDLTDSVIRLSAPPERITVARHSGPGLRMIIWTQGCSLLCTRHCLNPHLLKADGGYLLPASTVTQSLSALARVYSEVEGLTVLGGEPFDQARVLACALAPLKVSGLSIMVYTGHTLEALRARDDEGHNCLLSLCDILVDGPFIDELYDESLIWRGSTNQRILCLTDRYTQDELEQARSKQKRGAALSVGVRGDLAVSGAQNPEAARSLRWLTQVRKPSSNNYLQRAEEEHEQ
jgi:anaerobic ribonucleoside-triphosphate reductase activating protein